ncbi:MAG: hypothetical protein D6706_05720 [Chloroflexi bacterium]|nr:MAG: hypothetical protein D6706_05720 [Chloroflexota bacterium]
MVNGEKGKWLLWAGVILSVTAVSVLAGIMAGVFDPRPVGPLQTELTDLPVLNVPQGEEQIIWLETPLPKEAYSVQLTAVSVTGATDTGFGLVLGNETNLWGTAVSPLGYVTIWQRKNNHTITQLPWQTWPHIRLANAPNEIWVDVRPDEITVRINREFLWQGSAEHISGKIGLTGMGLGETAVIQFTTLKLYTAPPKS